MPRPITSIVFDVEGTLVDCVPHILESWQEILAAAGHGVPLAELQRYSGMHGRDLLNRLLPDVPHSARKRLLEAQGAMYRRDYLVKAKSFQGVRSLFLALRRTASRSASQPPARRTSSAATTR